MESIFYCEHDGALAQVGQRGWDVSILANVHEMFGHCAGQHGLGELAGAGKLNKMTSIGPL